MSGLIEQAPAVERVRAQGRPVQARWRIHYQDAGGALTIRTVLISHVLPRGEAGQILARCEKAGDERTYRLRRIRQAFDLDRAQRVPDPLQALLAQCPVGPATAAG